MAFIIDDISCGMESKKISFINDIDSEKLPQHFQYTSCNILYSEECNDDFETLPLPCTCSNCCRIDSVCFCKNNYGFAFLNHQLKSEFLSAYSKPIIECSLLCSCDLTCSNRVTQHGITYRLQIFKTKNKGFAVQTLENIKKFSFVCQYAGEIISINEAKRRFELQKDKDSNYIFVLKEHSLNKNNITIIDPTVYGSVGRFLNHSCSPNLFVVPIRINSMVPNLCFFANRDILPDEELCYDYGISNVTNSDYSVDSRLKKCECNSLNCSVFLPYYSDLLKFESGT